MGTPDDLDKSLTSIREHVLRLRESGVHVASIHIDAGLVKMTLESLDGAAPKAPRDPDQQFTDPMDDPAAYGLGPNARVPGFDRPTRDDEEPR